MNIGPVHIKPQAEYEHRQTQPTITSIHVDGFNTLSDFRLTLNPGLNILVGPNGSGKLGSVG